MHAVWEGRDPYVAQSLLSVAQDHGLGHAALNPYVYLPFTGLALGFLRPLPFEKAALVWFALNHIFLLVSIGVWAQILHEMTSRRRSYLFWLNLNLLAVAISHPLTRTLTAGQLNLVLLLCYVLAFHFAFAQRQFLAGGLLGFAALFKIAPGFFIIHWAWVRRWRVCAAMIVTLVVLSAVSVALAGWRPHADFIPMLRQMGYGKSTWQEHGATFWKDPWNQSINALLTHLLVEANRVTSAWLNLSQNTANIFTTLSSLLLCACYAVVGWRFIKRRAFLPPDEAVQVEQALYHAALLLTLLLPSLLWDHYLVFLLLPATWIIALATQQRRPSLAVLSALAYFITAIPIRFDSESFRSGYGILLMSAKLYPTLFLWALLLFLANNLQKSCAQASSAS